MEGPVFWIGFNAFVLVMIALDFFLAQRKPHAIKFREAMLWTAFWIGLAAAFAVLVYIWRGPQKTLEFATGYLIEESLSVDNLFVFLVLFRYFKVPEQYQRKVLTLGIVGALVMRGLFILVGVGLINRFHWIIYVFGVFLIYTGFTLLRKSDEDVDPEKNFVLRLARKWVPITKEYQRDHFFVKKATGLMATPLFAVLLVVETTDVVFALDSIPAILAISKDPFIVYTSNVFAILGLRALYFALAGMMDLFHYLHYGLAVILMFIGTKMLLSAKFEIPIFVALGAVVSLLAISIAASVLFPAKAKT